MASSKAKTSNRPVNRAGSGTGRTSARNGGAAARPASSAAARRTPPQGRPAAGRPGRPAAESAVEQSPAGPPAWFRIVTLLLTIAGLGVSAYLTYTHYAEKALLGCSENGTINCTKVTTSPQSMIFGHIPVALTGLVYYVYLVAIMSPWAWNSTWKWMPKLRLASVIAGVGMVLYLVYAELFQIDAICLYCTSVHIITFVLFVAITLAAALWGLAPPRRPQP
jgi:uncharacterized membrane protein